MSTYQLITWTEARTGLTGSEAMDLLEGHAGSDPCSGCS